MTFLIGPAWAIGLICPLMAVCFLATFWFFDSVAEKKGIPLPKRDKMTGKFVLVRRQIHTGEGVQGCIGFALTFLVALPMAILIAGLSDENQKVVLLILAVVGIGISILSFVIVAIISKGK